MSGNYPPGVTGFEPQIAGYDEADGAQELECACGWVGEVPTTEYISMGEVTWYAEWICPKCKESNSNEGWYDPNERG